MPFNEGVVLQLYTLATYRRRAATRMALCVCASCQSDADLLVLVPLTLKSKGLIESTGKG